MKLLVATDIHGSAYWTEKIVDKFNHSGADVLVLLGDIYNHGPRNPLPEKYDPMHVAELLNSVADKLLVIKGNCDSDVDQMISEFTFMQDNMLFLFGRRLYFTHGHMYNKGELPCLNQGDVIMYGHFHCNEISEKDGVTCVCVGSCALPKDELNSYAVVDETGIALFTFDDTIIAKKFF